MYDYLVVGAGLFGAVFAHEAYKHGKSVLVVEKRTHIAGNCYTENIEGICVHKYGAHIFHTNLPKVWEYVQQFTDFNTYTHRVAANFHGELYSLPFNMHTFAQMWGIATPEEAETKLAEQRLQLKQEPGNLEEQALSLVGKDVFTKLIQGYTEKQWGRSCKELPSSIIRRIPVRLTYDDSYFDAAYQGIPQGGYTELVAKLLEGIEVRLGMDYLEHRAELEPLASRIIFTGPIDAYYGYKLGALEYRTVRFENELLDKPDFQGQAVINYTDKDTPWTRIIEHKWFTFGKNIEGRAWPKTFISREYSVAWKLGEEPYYPVNDAKNTALYERYKKLAEQEDRVYFGGRLGEYRYYDMDTVIASALKLCEEILE